MKDVQKLLEKMSTMAIKGLKEDQKKTKRGPKEDQKRVKIGPKEGQKK